MTNFIQAFEKGIAEAKRLRSPEGKAQKEEEHAAWLARCKEYENRDREAEAGEIEHVIANLARQIFEATRGKVRVRIQDFFEKDSHGELYCSSCYLVALTDDKKKSLQELYDFRRGECFPIGYYNGDEDEMSWISSKEGLEDYLHLLLKKASTGDVFLELLK